MWVCLLWTGHQTTHHITGDIKLLQRYVVVLTLSFRLPYIHRHGHLWRSKNVSSCIAFKCIKLYRNWCYPGACFSKVPKLFGRISGYIIHFVSSKRKRLEARNFAFILIFIPFTTYEKTGFTELAGRSFTNGFSGPESFRDFRETGPRCSITLKMFLQRKSTG